MGGGRDEPGTSHHLFRRTRVGEDSDTEEEGLLWEDGGGQGTPGRARSQSGGYKVGIQHSAWRREVVRGYRDAGASVER